jgi:hypothetical protein
VNETSENIILIAHFDAFIWCIHGCTYWHSSSSLESILNDFECKCKSPPDKTTQSSQYKQCKRRKLIIPHPNLPHCGKRQHES